MSQEMNEAHFAEIEKTLLFISESRKRADRAAAALRREGAGGHLVAALTEASGDLAGLHRRLMQQTYFAVDVDEGPPRHPPA